MADAVEAAGGASPATVHARSRSSRPSDAPDRSIRRTWRVLVVAFVLLCAVAAIRIASNGAQPVDLVLAALVLVVGTAGLRYRDAVRRLDAGRRAEAESFARILQGLSRSVSPEAIVDAIVQEVGVATDADHVVVVRRRPAARILEATLVNRRAGVPNSSTLLPISDLEDPTAGSSGPRDRSDPDPAAAVGERIAARVRQVYGLRHTLTAPLQVDGEIVGAIVVNRRTRAGWPASAERMLAGAASEASAALSRAYSHQAAETRAATDALTGLPNRRYFEEYVTLLTRRRRAGDSLGVLMIDIDRFKEINDRHGHGVGDVVLREVGRAIAAALREDDVPARFGGEEFAVLLRNPGTGVAVEVGERVRAAVGALRVPALGDRSVSVSVGVAVAERPDEPVADLIVRADRALYAAKRAGRNCVIAG